MITRDATVARSQFQLNSCSAKSVSSYLRHQRICDHSGNTTMAETLHAVSLIGLIETLTKASKNLPVYGYQQESSITGSYILLL